MLRGYLRDVGTCSDSDVYRHAMASGRILGSSLKKSRLQYAGPISGFKHKIGVTPMTQHLPATC